MTVSTTISRVSYAGNGVTVAFSFPYYFLANADLVVIEKNNTTGVETVKVLTTHYTVTGAGVTAGGTVTMLVAPATGTTLIVYRDPALTQDLDLVENDSAPAEEIEKRFDKDIMVAQRLKDRMDRAVRLPEGFTATFDTTLPTILNAGAIIRINDDGDGFVEGPTVTDLEDAEENAAAAAASALAASNSAADASGFADDAEASATDAAASAAAAEAAIGQPADNSVSTIKIQDGAVTKVKLNTNTFIKTTQTKTSAYTLTASDEVILANASGGAFTLDLPTAVGISGKQYRIVKTDSTFNFVNINPTGSEVIDGLFTIDQLSTQYEAVTLLSDGANWIVTDCKTTTIWESYTPTFTGFGSVSGIDMWWMRDGAFLVIRGRFTMGTGTAVEARMTIPSGLITNSNGSTLEIAGTLAQNQTTAGGYYTAYEPVASRLVFTYQSSGTNALAKVNGNSFTASTVFAVSARVPIEYWYR